MTAARREAARDGASPTQAPADPANRLLAAIVEHATAGRYEGFLSQLGAEHGLSPTRVSRALKVLCEQQRVAVLQRGHGRSPTQLQVLSSEPVTEPRARTTRPALADRLLAHLAALSSDGVVERPLVDVAKELAVGPPSVSRALGQLVEEGRARVDRVGTRGRPTRIALVEPDQQHAGSRRGGRSARSTRELRAEVARLRAENERLAAEVARLRRELRRARRGSA